MSVRRRLAALLTVVLCMAASGAGSAAAAVPGEVTTFKTATGNCFGGDIAAAPKRGVLIRLCGKRGAQLSARIANLLPSGRIEKYGGFESRGGPILAGPGGVVWAAGYDGKSTVGIARFATDGSVESFPLGTEEDFRQIFVRGMVLDDEGALWTATGVEEDLGNGYDSLGGELVRIAADGTVTHFPLPEGIEPRGLALGPDGDLWFTGVRGHLSLERSVSQGAGYVGRMTPTGELTLFRPPGKATSPEGIAAGPDGKLWFVEGSGRVATIGVEGNFGRVYELRTDGFRGGQLEGSQGQLVFGREGDAWMRGFDDLIRITPNGQQTFFPDSGGDAIAVGPDGDIWSLGYGKVVRRVPGASGIDEQSMRADRRWRALHVKLACGGSKTPCTGTLELILKTPHPYRRRHPRQKNLPLGKVDYRVPAESSALSTVRLPDKARAIIGTFDPTYLTLGPTVLVRATVAGGPTLQRRVEVPSLVRSRDRRGR